MSKNSAAEHKKRLLIYGVYSKLLSAGRHHGAIQTNFRIIGSTWLLACFAGAGFLLTIDNILPFSHLLGVAGVCLVGIFGLYLIWYEDTYVQELLLDINVVEAIRLEKKYKWIPKVHLCFLHLYSKGSTPLTKIFFFIGCKTILIIIMAIVLGFYFYNISVYLMYLTVIFLLFLNYFSSRFMIKKAGEINNFMEFLNDADDRN